jgi:hypothetical protein
VSAYRLVYPVGDVVDRDGEVPEVGYDVDGYRVDFVRRRGDETVVYLGLHYGQTDVVKLAFIRVDDEAFPLTLAEAAELAERARDVSGGNLELPHHTIAVRLEQLVEEGVDTPTMDMLASEWSALRSVIARWIAYDGDDVPGRVRALQDALDRKAGEP